MMMRKALKLTISLGLAIALAVAVYLLFFNKAEEINYLTEISRVGSIRQTVNTTGEVGAVQLVTVGAQASGQIKKLHVKLGQQVKKGDMIAEIDSVTQLNDLSTNKAKLETYKAQLVSRKVALTVAQKQYNREQKLLVSKATSQENFENAQDALAAAKASVTEIESQIKQTQISVSTSETNLSYTKILAPLDGTIVSVPVEEGQTVNANQTTPTIVQITDLSTMEIKMQISEGDVTKIKSGMKVSYSILAEPNQTYTGELNSIDPGLTTLTEGTYKGSTDSSSAVYYYGNLIVPNEEGKLRIGMTTQNTIIVASADDVLIIPTITINEQDGKLFVNVLQKKGQVQRKEVTTGLADSMNTQVLSGLEEGEEIISAQMSASEISSSASTQMRGGPRMSK